MKRVVIFGGGVAGLTVAHELACRGVKVVVHERHRLGGKCSSQFMGQLPGEHGFRFFPGWYLHLTGMLRRIPRDPSSMVAAGGVQGFDDNLAQRLLPVEFTWACWRDRDGEEARQIARQAADAPAFLSGLFSLLHGIPRSEVALFAARSSRNLLRFFLTPPERRHELFDGVSLGAYLGVEENSSIGLALRRIPKALVAMDGFAGSATTFLNSVMLNQAPAWRDDLPLDRVLMGPTSKVWIEPWVEALKVLGVEFVDGPDAQLDRLVFANGKLEGAVTPAGAIAADAFVLALGVDALKAVLLRSNPPATELALAKVRDVDLDRHTSWMVGLQLYLKQVTSWPSGHVLAVDSPYGITAIDQTKVWDAEFVEPLAAMATPVRGLVSAIVTQWTNDPGNGQQPAPGQLASANDLIAQVVDQLALSRAPKVGGGGPLLKASDLLSWRVDDGIQFAAVQSNASLMLVHPPGGWDQRPEPVTGFDNLFLASDFVRNPADLATMEGACSASARAANAILARFQLEPDVPVYDLVRELEPSWMKKARGRFLDRVVTRAGGFGKAADRLFSRFDVGKPDVEDSASRNLIERLNDDDGSWIDEGDF